MDRDALIKSIRKLRPALEAEGVAHIALFGSRARGDHKPTSDLDILLDVVPGRRLSLLDVIGIQHIVSDTTGLTANATLRRSIDSELSRATEPDLVQVF